MDETSDLRMRGGPTIVDVSDTMGTIHPFAMKPASCLQTLRCEVGKVFAEKQGKKLLFYLVANILITTFLFTWCNTTNSMALTAFSYLTLFDIFSLMTCLVTLWVAQQKASSSFSFGYGRFEVLSVFASTLLATLGALFIIKESVERMVEQPEIHTGRLLVGGGLAFLSHIAVTYGVDNKALNHVVAASSSSWLQEHVADMSESLCMVVPGLSKLLLPRINPFALIAMACSTSLVIVYVLIDVNNYYASDTWAAVWIALMTWGTMFPMSVYTGKILLQTTPSHMIGQLDKVLREASTLDGVLEFRHEHFWTLSFGTIAGSVHVRVRRDADEQMVLAHVAHRLSNIVTVLTVQVFKDDWSRQASAYQIIADTALLAKYPSPAHGTPPVRLPLGNTDSNALLGMGSQRGPYRVPPSSLPPASPPSPPANYAPPPVQYPYTPGSRMQSTSSPIKPSYTGPVGGASFSRTSPPLLAQTYGTDLSTNHQTQPMQSSGHSHRK